MSLRVGVQEDNCLSTAESPDAALRASDVRSTTFQTLNALTLTASAHPVFNGQLSLLNFGLTTHDLSRLISK